MRRSEANQKPFREKSGTQEELYHYRESVTAAKRTGRQRAHSKMPALGIAFQWTVYRISESESLQSVPDHTY